ncbi:hypothetical protein KR044_007690 [Drosophila immigrans]|nr:hypothetical protein KR044_007690 [Drosophila immigrans]
MLFLSLLLAGAMGRPAHNTLPKTTLPPCTPWCAGQPPPPPGAVN